MLLARFAVPGMCSPPVEQALFNKEMVYYSNNICSTIISQTQVVMLVIFRIPRVHRWVRLWMIPATPPPQLAHHHPKYVLLHFRGEQMPSEAMRVSAEGDSSSQCEAVYPPGQWHSACLQLPVACLHFLRYWCVLSCLGSYITESRPGPVRQDRQGMEALGGQMG